MRLTHNKRRTLVLALNLAIEWQQSILDGLEDYDDSVRRICELNLSEFRNILQELKQSTR